LKKGSQRALLMADLVTSPLSYWDRGSIGVWVR